MRFPTSWFSRNQRGNDTTGLSARWSLGYPYVALITRSHVASAGTDRTEVYRRGRKVVIEMVGFHSTEAAVQATQTLARLVAEVKGPVEVIGDLRKMGSFTNEGRVYWQRVFQQVRSHVALITLVQGSALARMSAIAVGLYAGIKVRSVETLEQAMKETK
jgi:hypothetical protein